jgi:hypothetical protein
VRNAAGVAGGKIVQPETPIRAYHSSPYDFEKFDLSKLGTGEGGRAYGAGVNLAESPTVSGRNGMYWKQLMATHFKGTPEGEAAFNLRKAGRPPRDYTESAIRRAASISA